MLLQAVAKLLGRPLTFGKIRSGFELSRRLRTAAWLHSFGKKKISAREKRGVALETRTDWKTFVFSLEITDRLLQDVGGARKYTYQYNVLLIAGGVKHRLSQLPISALR